MELTESDTEDLYILVVEDSPEHLKRSLFEDPGSSCDELDRTQVAQVKLRDQCKQEGDVIVKIEPIDLKLESDEEEDSERGLESDNVMVNDYVKNIRTHTDLLQPIIHESVFKDIGGQYRADTLLDHESVKNRNMITYKSNKLLPRQIRRAVKIPCTICGKMICNANMKLHMEVHSEAKKYWCPHCPARFRTKRAVQAHLNAHSGTRPYRCDQCPRAYTSDTALRAHKMDHGEKNYKCEYCKRAYSRKHTLKLHLTTHSDGREYLCPECGKVFNNQYGLEAHSRQHRGKPNKFSCMDCGKMYAKMTGLNVHMKKKHGHQIITRKMFFNSLPLMVDESCLLVVKDESSDTMDDPDAVCDLETRQNSNVDEVVSTVSIPDATFQINESNDVECYENAVVLGKFTLDHAK